MTYTTSIQAVQTAVEQAFPSLPSCHVQVLGERVFGMIII